MKRLFALSVIMLSFSHVALADFLCVKKTVRADRSGSIPLSSLIRSRVSCPSGYAAVINTDLFKGPAGEKGETGATGQAGATGLKGDTGPAGPRGDSEYVRTTLIAVAELSQSATIAEHNVPQKLGNIGTFSKQLGAADSRIDIEYSSSLTTDGTNTADGLSAYCVLEIRVDDNNESGWQTEAGLGALQVPGAAIQNGQGSSSYTSRVTFTALEPGTHTVSLWLWGTPGTQCQDNRGAWYRQLRVHELKGTTAFSVYYP